MIRGGRPSIVPVGSHAVREAIKRYQPVVGLHGHIHESRGAQKIGRTLCVNPGSDYSSGVLRGAVIDIAQDGSCLSILLQCEIGPGAALDGSFVADLCARDWGPWRTCVGSLDRLRANLESSPLDPGEAGLVASRLAALRGYLDAAPKTTKWRLRSRVGDKVRWYQQPEEEGPAG